MTDEQRNEIAFKIARRALWTQKPPENEDVLRKWLKDGANEYDLSVEEFTEFAHTALSSAFDSTLGRLKHFCNTDKSKKKIGFQT